MTGIKIINDRGRMGRAVRDWTWGLGNEAQECEVLYYHGTYAASKRAALAAAETAGYSVIECYRDADCPRYLRKR